jgi:hypothetical protein
MSDVLPVAYSQLAKVLAKCRFKVSDLHDKLKAAGVNVNQKSLYRLTSSAPLQKIDTRIIGAICQTCAVNIQDVIVFERPKPVLQKLPNAEQKRLDELMARHNEGKLSARETSEFDELSEKAHELTMANARMLVAQRRSLPSQRPRRIRVHPHAPRKHPQAAKKVAQH